MTTLRILSQSAHILSVQFCKNASNLSLILRTSSRYPLFRNAFSQNLKSLLPNDKYLGFAEWNLLKPLCYSFEIFFTFWCTFFVKWTCWTTFFCCCCDTERQFFFQRVRRIFHPNIIWPTFSVVLSLRKPERGLNFMMEKNFVGTSPQEVAQFLFTRKGLSRRMIGEYLGLLNNRFAQLVLEWVLHCCCFFKLLRSITY